MAVIAKEVYLRKKFINAFLWATGIFTAFSLILFGIIIDDSAVLGKIMMINILGALILGLFAGVFAMLIPSSMKVVYIPISLVITFTISFLMSSLFDNSKYLTNGANSERAAIFKQYLKEQEEQYDVSPEEQSGEVDSLTHGFED